MRLVKWLSLALAIPLLACSAPQANAPSSVRIVFTQRPPELPFDPQDARLRGAQAQLAELLGHGIVFDIDAALLPQWQGSFRGLLTDSIENVARDARDLKEREPAAFDAELSKLQRIECRYVATRPSRRSELTPDGTILRVFSTADDRDLVPRGLVAQHVARAFGLAQQQKFGNASARSVRSDERDDYFRDLTSRRDKRDDNLAESVRAAAITSAIELDALSREPLRSKIRHWLASDGAAFFSSAYGHRGAEVKTYGKASRFRSAERAFAGWVDSAQKALPEGDRLTLLKHLYPRPFTQDREPGRSYVSFAFPGMDRDGILFDVLDEWIADGHRMPDGGGNVRNQRATAAKPKALHEYVLCPRPKSSEGERSMGPHCDDTLYARAAEEPAVAARLASTLLAKKDALLTETVFANLTQRPRIELAIALWRKLDDARDEAGARVASAVMLELAEQGDSGLLAAEARARLRGPARGSGLYLLAVVDRYARDKVDWASFSTTYGPIRDLDYRDFLRAGPHAVALVPRIWPALDSSVKQAEPLLGVYDAFLQSPETRRYDMQDPWKAWRTIHASFCRDGLMNEVAVLRRWYETQKLSDPQHARIYVDFLDETSPTKCRYDYEHEQRRKRMDVRNPWQKTREPKKQNELDRKAADDQRRRNSDRPEQGF